MRLVDSRLYLKKLNLIFYVTQTMAKTGEDVEILYLENGVMFRARPCDVCSHLVNNMEEIYIVIDLKGIRVCSTDERVRDETRF
jgi:hypothetical protein